MLQTQYFATNNYNLLPAITCLNVKQHVTIEIYASSCLSRVTDYKLTKAVRPKYATICCDNTQYYDHALLRQPRPTLIREADSFRYENESGDLVTAFLLRSLAKARLRVTRCTSAIYRVRATWRVKFSRVLTHSASFRVFAHLSHVTKLLTAMHICCSFTVSHPSSVMVRLWWR